MNWQTKLIKVLYCWGDNCEFQFSWNLGIPEADIACVSEYHLYSSEENSLFNSKNKTHLYILTFSISSQKQLPS